jgi:hypothetical protein
MKGHHGHIALDAGLDLSPIGKKDNEVDVERSVGRGF